MTYPAGAGRPTTMNTTTKPADGGPAFPVSVPLLPPPQPELSLRDHFAGLAMQGELASQGDDDGSSYVIGDEDDLARWCYRMADAMLRARQACQEGGAA